MPSPLSYGSPLELVPQIGNYDVSKTYNRSLFNDKTKMAFNPRSVAYSSDGKQITEPVKSNYPIHDPGSYELSLSKIIEWSNSKNLSSIKLRPIDFAYLKDVGVYPNNRLIICRRFPHPITDDIFDSNVSPVSTIVSWAPEGEDLFDLSFGEKWTDSEADFTSILNEIGKDFTGGGGAGGDGLGTMMGGGMGAVPLPGFTEFFVRQVMKNLGLTEFTAAPEGNPNLIKTAKRRELVSKGDKGSGLKAKVQVKVKVTYEQKFIAGVDPTLAFYDILNNLMSFGTSKSIFYLSNNTAEKFKNWLDLLGSNPLEAVKQLVESAISAVEGIINTLSTAIGGSEEDEGDSDSDKKEAETKIAEDLLKYLQDSISKLASFIVEKYRIKLMGVAHALTGAPSAPWHVSIGNPQRPIFMSGDMVCDEVKIKFNDTLAFNDLPSSIEAEFSLENARDLGLQEIYSKFQGNKPRAYAPAPTLWDVRNGADLLSENSVENNSDATLPGNTASTIGSQNSSNVNLSNGDSNLNSLGTQSYALGDQTGTDLTLTLDQQGVIADPEQVKNIENITDNGIIQQPTSSTSNDFINDTNTTSSLPEEVVDDDIETIPSGGVIPPVTF